MAASFSTSKEEGAAFDVGWHPSICSMRREREVLPMPEVATPHVREQRGSILILSVGVLLLLAVVATAFLGNARTERVAVHAYSVNTQVELLLDGVLNAVKGEIAGDDSVPGGPAATTSDAVGGETSDGWLASRIPTTLDANSAYNANALNVGPNAAWWLGISKPVLGDQEFESPYMPAGSGSARYAAHTRVAPTYVTFGGQTWPALTINAGTPQAKTYMAADADGDGVADAGLFRIPVGDLGGVSYFAATRIIDNCSAINLNSALSRDHDFAGDGTEITSLTPNRGVFLSSIGLSEMLRSALPDRTAPISPQFDNMANGGSANEYCLLNQYRLGVAASPPRPGGVQGNSSDPAPYSDGYRSFRTDYQYASIGEAFQNILGIRPANPGISGAALSSARSAFFDSLALAERFTLASRFDTSNRLLETIEKTSQSGPLGHLRNSPYAPSDPRGGIDIWFKQNFNVNAEDPADSNTFMSRRA
ncbi:MAG: hypothetical protein JWM57_3633, partial [Phycisphaerales bacterium]|nr:hypothetical protein [Phycisphaerales bacterium]